MICGENNKNQMLEEGVTMAITIIITQGGLIAVTILVMVNIIIIINHVGMCIGYMLHFTLTLNPLELMVM